MNGSYADLISVRIFSGIPCYCKSFQKVFLSTLCCQRCSRSQQNTCKREAFHSIDYQYRRFIELRCTNFTFFMCLVSHLAKGITDGNSDWTLLNVTFCCERPCRPGVYLNRPFFGLVRRLIEIIQYGFAPSLQLLISTYWTSTPTTKTLFLLSLKKSQIT